MMKTTKTLVKIASVPAEFEPGTSQIQIRNITACASLVQYYIYAWTLFISQYKPVDKAYQALRRHE
jgi:hypothetical protein